MAGALNLFKTVLANATTAGDTVYTAAIGYSSVVLLAQISNTNTANTVGISAQITRVATTGPDIGNVIAQTVLVANTQIPVGDAVSILTGRLILNFGDSLEILASEDNSAQLTLSLLETLTG
jgi:hypothetical protein